MKVRKAALVALISLVGPISACGGDNDKDGTRTSHTDAGAANTGGSTSDDGGTTAGGMAATGGSRSSGGSGPTGGRRSSGGSPSDAGSSSDAGSTSTGGTASGGSSSSGGSGATGGTSPSGGSSSTGGRTSRGGSITGGSSPTGGSGVTGGASSSGGSSSTGGRTSRGGSLTGGSSSTGGASSTGGGPTGGSPATGGATSSELPTVGGCTMFTADDEWNRDIFDAEVDADWTERLHALVDDVNIHPDFGGEGEYGIAVNVVPQDQPRVDIALEAYPEESDPGPFPFPVPGVDTFQIEGNNPEACDGDCHLLVVQSGTCRLYEGGGCEYQSDGWHCGCTAEWDLKRNSYGQREMGWTSVDAAGLPVAAGILRYAEVLAGAVRHAVRFTVECTQAHYVRPASHYAVPGGCDPDDASAPPMGLRVRLGRGYDMSGLSEPTRVILTGMQHYGLMLADNGSNFFFQGDMDPAWPGDVLDELKSVPATAFEVVAPVPELEP
jgi:hypothetical protein